MNYDIRFLQEGRKRVTTASGSVYIIDFDAMTFQREPGEGANKLRKDTEEISILEVITFEPDVMMEFVCKIRTDDAVTYRRTSAVESVEEL